MLTTTILFLMALAVMILFPETPLARTLRRWLVEAPARALNRATIWRLAFYAGLIAAGILMLILFEAEGALLYGLMAPEVLVWATLFDVGLVIDALLITAAILATNGVRAIRTQVSALAVRAIAVVRRAVRREGRSRPAARPRRKPFDDDRPAWAQPPYRAFSMA